MRIRSYVLAIMCVALSAIAMGCSSDRSVAPSTPGAQLDSADAAARTTADFRNDSDATKFFDSAIAYAVFPKITKGALGIGVSDGRGEVFQDGVFVGYAQATSVTIGAQIGGQTFSQIIFFQNSFAFDKFTNNQFTGQASAAAVAGKSGSSAMADYNHGVAVFTSNNNGLILAADIGGQKFRYTAK
jgi:lipid-binding SYLF domain-containing protein